MRVFFGFLFLAVFLATCYGVEPENPKPQASEDLETAASYGYGYYGGYPYYSGYPSYGYGGYYGYPRYYGYRGYPYYYRGYPGYYYR